MGVRELKHQAKLAEWKEIVVECRSSGEKVSEWCREHGISSKTYHRWERELVELAGTTMAEAGNGRIAALPMERGYVHSEVAGRIRCGEVEVEIEKGADAETIRAMIEAVRGC